MTSSGSARSSEAFESVDPDEPTDRDYAIQGAISAAQNQAYQRIWGHLYPGAVPKVFADEEERVVSASTQVGDYHATVSIEVHISVVNTQDDPPEWYGDTTDGV